MRHSRQKSWMWKEFSIPRKGAPGFSSLVTKRRYLWLDQFRVYRGCQWASWHSEHQIHEESKVQSKTEEYRNLSLLGIGKELRDTPQAHTKRVPRTSRLWEVRIPGKFNLCLRCSHTTRCEWLGLGHSSPERDHVRWSRHEPREIHCQEEGNGLPVAQ